MSDDSSNEQVAPVAKSRAGWNGATAIGVVLLIYFVGLFSASLFVGIYGHLVHGLAWNAMDPWLKNSIEAQAVYYFFDAGVSFLLLWGFIRLRRYRHVLSTLGLRKPFFRDVGYALLGFGVYFAIYFIVATILNGIGHLNVDQKQNVGFQALTTHGELLLAFVSLVVVPPLLEETLFRGFLFGGFRRKLAFVPAMLATSALFALPHLFESQQGEGLLWIAGLDTFILSLVLCFLREKTGRLWAGIGVHALKNGIAFAVLFLLQ